MEKKEIIEIVIPKLKLIRTEFDLTQEEMADIIGVSKKTLVEMEKGRNKGNWGVVIAIVALFGDSEILLHILGEDALDIVTMVARKNIIDRKEKTLGGKVWWRVIKTKSKYTLQQNVVSMHYRILDEELYRYFSTFNQKEALDFLEKLSNGNSSI